MAKPLAKSSPPRPSPAYPVHTLREQATALEAAIALTLVKPRKKSVHQLRTSTRRIEAQLELLGLLEPDLPALRGLSKSTRKLTRLLRDVRRAAGKVRDLDVQHVLIEKMMANSAKNRVRQDAKHLRRTLKAQRSMEATSLMAELQGHARKLGPRLEALLDSLEPAADLSLSPARLGKLICSWYDSQTRSSDITEKALHGIRKAAKLARYMAQSGDVPLLAQDFENTQQLGGTWHDALTLCQVARHQLGRKADIVALFSRQEQAALNVYRARLRDANAGVNRRPNHMTGCPTSRR